ADLLAVSSDDARAGGAPLKRLLRPRQELIVTGGARGTLHLRRVAAGVAGWRVPALPARTVVDPTGAGDVLLAAWLAARLCAPAAAGWRQLALAAAAASLSVEGVGLAGVAPLGAVGDLLRSGGAPGG
ncbi:MAG TPA: PfkB family carbohydrate kinase, partial [Candidatus Limnocylindria bacterium]|nr:PfkB family carbohydrate kinase [Candidatus Limnocylindria bacterium]